MNSAETQRLARRSERGHAALGYGVLFWPEDLATVKAKAPEAINLEGL